ncbi:MAG: SDR family oxidoreductase [Thermomicrobiales bacterium]
MARGDGGREGANRVGAPGGGTGRAVPPAGAPADAVERAAAAVEREFGPITIWVNDAMASVFSPFKEMTAAEFKRVTEVTYLGQVYGTMAALKRMLQRDQGTIVQVGSALAYRGIPLQSAYCGAKHAIQGFTEAVRAELLHDGSNVKITMVQMPALNTPQFGWVKSRLPHKAQPVSPIFQPEVAARAIWWAAHHYRRQWYVGGSTSVVMFGNKIAPGLGDRYLAKTGFQSQQTGEPRDPNRPDNLWQPVDNQHDHGAHGAFDDRATDHSTQFWLTTHRNAVLAGLAGAAGVAATLGTTLARRAR